MQQNGQFLLFNRDEFKDWLFSNNFARKINVLQTHHTWKPDYSNFTGNNHFAMLKGMKDYHVNSAKFSDIAQNLTLFPDGLIAICRTFEKDPAGISGCNKGAICMENIGNFDIGNDILTEEHKKSIVFVNAVMCMKFNLPVDTKTIVYHHWFNLSTGTRNDGGGNNKTCPGTNFFGGNSVQTCKDNFLPLVDEQIAKLTKSDKDTEPCLISSRRTQTRVHSNIMGM